MPEKSKRLYDTVRKFVRQHTTPDMSRPQKLRACFDYITSPAFLYIPQPEFRNVPSWKRDYAYRMLTTKRGVCYDFAAAFGFVAREVGYSDVEIYHGAISSAYGGYADHGWVEIKIGGVIYIFDTSMHHGSRGDYYRKTYENVGREYVRY